MCNATRQPAPVERLRDGEFEAFLAEAPDLVVVEFSTNWSMDCRLLRPLVRKLALQFAGEVAVVALDGDEAHGFRSRYGVAAVPQLIAFERRRLTGRHIGAGRPRQVQDWFLSTFRLAAGAGCPGEAAFQAAWARAKATFDDILAPASRAVKPHLDAVGPHMDALERRLAADREAGRLTDEQEMERRSAEFERVFGPFRAELDALAAAEQVAIRAYEDIMAEALDEYAADRARAAGMAARQGFLSM